MIKYVKLHEEFAVSPLTISPNHCAFASELLKKLIGGIEVGKDCFCPHKNTGLGYYDNLEIWDKASNYIIDKLQKDKKFANLIKIKSINIANRLVKKIRVVDNEDFTFWSDPQIVAFLKETYKLGMEFSAYGYVPVISDLYFHKYTHLLKGVIKKHVLSRKLKISVPECLTLLSSSPRAILSKEFRLELLRELMLIKDVKLIQSRTENLKKIFHRWHWVDFGHFGPPAVFRDFITGARALLKNKNKLAAEYRELISYPENLIKKQKQLFKRLGLNNSEKRLFIIAQEFMYIKGLRLETLYGMCAQWSRLLTEISHRIGIKKDLLYYSSVEELYLWLLKKKIPKVNILKERKKFCVWVAKSGYTQVIYSGARAKKYLDIHAVKEKSDYNEVLNIHGTVASAGYAKGRAKIVNKAEEMGKINTGDIMISIATNPTLLPAMKKASAFVTDEGGITSHAAIVAREFKKPCIIGTKIATKVLKDGDWVELDTKKGDVHKVSHN